MLLQMSSSQYKFNFNKIIVLFVIAMNLAKGCGGYWWYSEMMKFRIPSFEIKSA